MIAKIGKDALSSAASSANYNKHIGWQPLNELCTEHYQAEPTRAGEAENKDEDRYYVAPRIDKIYMSVEVWQLTLTNSKTFTTTRVIETERQIAIDHAPVPNPLSCKQISRS